MTIETARFVNGDQLKIRQIGVLADVLDDYVNSTTIKPNEVSFSSPIELVSSLTIKLFNTTDSSLPSNLKLEILGCYDETVKLSTKAQVEDG